MKDVLIVCVSRGLKPQHEIAGWLLQCFNDTTDPNANVIAWEVLSAEPTTRARNMAVRAARQLGLKADDVLIQVDDDMGPNQQWFNRATRFLADYEGPTMFGSPYCGDKTTGHRVEVQHIDGHRYSHAEAAACHDIDQVAGMGTGLFACNMAAFDAVEKAGLLPWFDYEYGDEPFRCDIARTDDFWFCSRLYQAGGRVFCDWESWSYHYKTEAIGKPEKPTTVDSGNGRTPQSSHEQA